MRRPTSSALPWILSLTAACATTAPAPAPTPPESNAQADESHFPEAFPNAAIGMPLETWRKTRPSVAIPSVGSMSFRIEIVEPNPVPGVVEATWYFDADLPGQPLYEVIVDYGQNVDALQRALAALGPTQGADGEWVFPTSQAHSVKVWTFGTTIVSAANMRGTEWENGW